MHSFFSFLFFFLRREQIIDLFLRGIYKQEIKLREPLSLWWQRQSDIYILHMTWLQQPAASFSFTKWLKEFPVWQPKYIKYKILTSLLRSSVAECLIWRVECAVARRRGDTPHKLRPPLVADLRHGSRELEEEADTENPGRRHPASGLAGAEHSHRKNT